MSVDAGEVDHLKCLRGVNEWRVIILSLKPQKYAFQYLRDR